MYSNSRNNGNNTNTKRIEKDAEEIKALIIESQKDTCIFLLVVLQSIINEQITAKELKRETGKYLYQAVKDQCIRKGWIE
jgi:hypothetical protein